MNTSSLEKVIEHRIQKYMIGVLIHQKFARFRDLRPPKTDTNLFSYHLKALVRDGFIEKRPEGYTLSTNGLGYVDRVSLKKMNVRSQPKIITMLLVRDENNRILLQCRRKQPYIDTWTLPYGKTHISDPSLLESARRETLEKLGVEPKDIIHIGDAYIRVVSGDNHLSTTLAHLCELTFETLPTLNDDLMWVKIDGIGTLPLAPAVRPLIEAADMYKDRFFIELQETWQ